MTSRRSSIPFAIAITLSLSLLGCNPADNTEGNNEQLNCDNLFCYLSLYDGERIRIVAGNQIVLDTFADSPMPNNGILFQSREQRLCISDPNTAQLYVQTMWKGKLVINDSFLLDKSTAKHHLSIFVPFPHNFDPNDFDQDSLNAGFGTIQIDSSMRYVTLRTDADYRQEMDSITDAMYRE